MRRKNSRACLLASLIALLVAACTSALSERDAYPLPPATQALATLIARGVATSDHTEYPPPIPGPLAPPATALPETHTYPSSNQNPDLPVAVHTARGFLAGSLSLPVQQVSLVSWRAATWITPDLGCQIADDLDLQKPTSGYLIRLEAGGQSYELHSDQYGEYLCLADQLQQGERLSQVRDLTAEETAELARSHLASRLGFPPNEVRVERIDKTQWADDDLGCPILTGQPLGQLSRGKIRGYRILLSAVDQAYEYHSGGDWLIYCR